MKLQRSALAAAFLLSSVGSMDASAVNYSPIVKPGAVSPEATLVAYETASVQKQNGAKWVRRAASVVGASIIGLSNFVIPNMALAGKEDFAGFDFNSRVTGQINLDRAGGKYIPAGTVGYVEVGTFFGLGKGGYHDTIAGPFQYGMTWRGIDITRVQTRERRFTEPMLLTLENSNEVAINIHTNISIDVEGVDDSYFTNLGFSEGLSYEDKKEIIVRNIVEEEGGSDWYNVTLYEPIRASTRDTASIFSTYQLNTPIAQRFVEYKVTEFLLGSEHVDSFDSRITTAEAEIEARTAALAKLKLDLNDLQAQSKQENVYQTQILSLQGSIKNEQTAVRLLEETVAIIKSNLEFSDNVQGFLKSRPYYKVSAVEIGQVKLPDNLVEEAQKTQAAIEEGNRIDIQAQNAARAIELEKKKAEGQAEANKILDDSLTDNVLRFKSLETATQMAKDGTVFVFGDGPSMLFQTDK